jgi:hypothetical protein
LQHRLYLVFKPTKLAFRVLKNENFLGHIFICCCLGQWFSADVDFDRVFIQHIGTQELYLLRKRGGKQQSLPVWSDLPDH